MGKIEPSGPSGGRFILGAVQPPEGEPGAGRFGLARPIIQTFDSPVLYLTKGTNWKSNAATLLESEPVVSLDYGQYVFIEEGESVLYVDEQWLSMLSAVAPEILEWFGAWSKKEGFRVRVDSMENLVKFATFLSDRIEHILMHALRSKEEQTSALSLHLFQTANTIAKSTPEARDRVLAAVCVARGDKEGLKAIEGRVGRLKRGKWSRELEDYLIKNHVPRVL